MSLIMKLTTALRGGVREAAEAVVDANSLRIFEQEIHDCETVIQQAKQDLSHVMAEKIKLKRDSAPLEEVIRQKETQAAEALQLGEDELALDLAGLIAEKERVLQDQRDKCRELEAHERRLQQSLGASVRQVQDYRRELRLVQATASAQKASRKLADKTHSMSSKIVNMETSLERIKQTQHDVADQIEAMAQVNVGLSDQTLDERIVAAGISGAKDPAEEVLKRLRDKAKSGNS